MIKILEKILMGLMCLLPGFMAAGILSSCDATEAPPYEDGGQSSASTVSFKFKIYADAGRERSVGASDVRNESTAGAAGRSTRAFGVWDESAADVAERILDKGDFRVLIFEESSAGGSLLTTVSPTQLDYEGGNGNDGYYNLSLNFSHPYFDKFKDDEYVEFFVIILANIKSIGGEYVSYAEGSSPSDVKQDFIVKTGYYPRPDAGIPMYGRSNLIRMQKRDMLDFDASPATTINLIRSLCKIEVSDKIVNAAKATDGKKYPRVESVEMVSWLDRGYARPAYDTYASGLRTANIFPAAATTTAVNATEVEENLFRIFCPEARMENMRFRVNVMMSPAGPLKSFDVSLDDYSSAIGVELVRNHIYRFEVKAVNTYVDLGVAVSEWQTVTDEFELDNIVSMEPDGFLKWKFDGNDFAVSTEAYRGEHEQQLSLLNSTTGYATGTFHILSPMGATWKAYFIPGENGVDAFEFVDVDSDGNVIPGSASVFAEGTVGTKATIHIRGKGAADSYRHWAELVVEVHTIDGSILHAPLTATMSPRFIIYRENRM